MSHRRSFAGAGGGTAGLLVLFSLAFLTVPHACAQAPEKGPPDLRAALLDPVPFPESLVPKPDVVHDWTPVRPAKTRRRMTRDQQCAWLLLGVAQHGAAFFDARTTREAMAHYHELDPLMRPFAHSAAIYPAMQILPFGFDWLATRLATSRHRWLRRLWWLPQGAAVAGFVWSGVHNLDLPTPPGDPAH